MTRSFKGPSLLFVLSLCFSLCAYSIQSRKDEIAFQKILVIDTSKVDTSDSSDLDSKEYYRLFEELLDQKQAHYDSTLNSLSWWAGIIGIILTLVIFIFVLFGIQEFRAMKKEMRDELQNKTLEITDTIKKKLGEESEKIANDLITKKYEQDISDIKEKVNNLEEFSREISESYVLRYEKDKPELKELNEEERNNENPWEKKK